MPDRDHIGRQQSARRLHGQPAQRPEDVLAAGLMELNQHVRPFHEWLAGQRAYFIQQGYSDDEARAMAAAMFVSLFGSNISRTVAEQLPEEGDQP